MISMGYFPQLNELVHKIDLQEEGKHIIDKRIKLANIKIKIFQQSEFEFNQKLKIWFEYYKMKEELTKTIWLLRTKQLYIEVHFM